MNSNSLFIELRFGADACNNLMLENGMRIDFYYDDANPRIWLLKKSDDGYMITKEASKKFPLKIQLKLPKIMENLMRPFDMNVRHISYKETTEGILIDTSHP